MDEALGPSPMNGNQNVILATLGGSLCPVCENPVCSSIEFQDFHLYNCPSCRSWCSDAMLRNAETSFSPDTYFANSDYDQDKWEALLERLDRQGRRIQSVLDIGCGTGAFLSFFSDRYPGARISGIELDPKRADLAVAANRDATIHVGDALEALENVEGEFDLITLWDVFEHIPAPGSLLQAGARRLSEGGCIFIQTIHEHSIVPFLGRLSYRLTRGRLRYLARRTHEAHHLVFFSKKGLSILASKANLQIEDLWFDRLALSRMDGSRLLTTAASLMLNLENALGNGLFVNVILDAGIGEKRG